MRKFDIAIVTKSDTAIRREINEQFNPGPTVVTNARALHDNILSKLPASIAYIITSWYRCPRLNKMIGGSSTSDHMSGRSADLDSANNMSNAQLFDFIRTNCNFDQLIWEFGNDTNPDWVHVSYRSTGNRKQVLRAVKSNGKTIYKNFAR
jgi:hypothetical protein